MSVPDPLLEVPLTEFPEVFLDETFDMVQDSSMDSLAQYLRRGMPFLEYRVDEGFLDNEWVMTG